MIVNLKKLFGRKCLKEFFFFFFLTWTGKKCKAVYQRVVYEWRNIVPKSYRVTEMKPLGRGRSGYETSFDDCKYVLDCENVDILKVWPWTVTPNGLFGKWSHWYVISLIEFKWFTFFIIHKKIFFCDNPLLSRKLG